jgi:ankyrin repeat protein
VKLKLLKLLPGAYAFASAVVLSLAIVSVLPAAKLRRQRSFAEAIMDGSFRRAQMLRLAGADINARGNCCLPLYLAAGEGRLDVVRYLLDRGADVNAREKLGDTALTEASYYGHVDIVKELIFRGADLNAIGDNGTALDVATNRKHAEIADLLRHHGGKKACDIRKCN